jgi:hypothetical protein
MSNFNLDEINKIQENIYKIMNKCKEDNNSYLTDKNKKINKILSLIDSNFEKKQKEIGKEELEIRVKESDIIKFNLYNEILKSNVELKNEENKNIKNLLYIKFNDNFSQLIDFYNSEIKQLSEKENKIQKINFDLNNERINKEIERYLNLYKYISGINFIKLNISKVKIQLFFDEELNLNMNEFYIILEYNNRFYKIIETQPKINFENYEKRIIEPQNLSYFISCVMKEFEKYLFK